MDVPGNYESKNLCPCCVSKTPIVPIVANLKKKKIPQKKTKPHTNGAKCYEKRAEKNILEKLTIPRVSRRSVVIKKREEEGINRNAFYLA